MHLGVLRCFAVERRKNGHICAQANCSGRTGQDPSRPAGRLGSAALESAADKYLRGLPDASQPQSMATIVPPSFSHLAFPKTKASDRPLFQTTT